MKLLAAISLGLVLVGCGFGSHSKPDIAAAKKFSRFPLYWAGGRFERWDLAAIDGLYAGSGFVTFIYGTCTPSGGEQPSCEPPLEIQVFPLCPHLDVAARSPSWRHRRIRGAPVGTQDGAPVLFTRAAWIKVYRGEDTDPGVAQRALKALRSLNSVPPVIGATGTIPGTPPGILDGTQPCTS